MSDDTQFYLIVFLGMFLVLWIIFKQMAKHYNSKKEDPEKKFRQTDPSEIDKDYYTDVVNNPIFSDSKINMFHDDHKK